MLAAKCYPTSSTNEHRPWLVFIHGFLGDGRDWQSILPHFRDWPCITIDLPGHGESQSLCVSGFEELNQRLSQTLLHYNIQRYILIGYSLGGRSAMYYTCFGDCAGLAGLIIEGGNPGLISSQQRKERYEHDHHWADKFRRHALSEVLSQWYRQPVFADLSEAARQQLIMRRSGVNSGVAVAKMLESTSLGQQPWLTEQLNQSIKQRNIPFCYLCGEQDAKFQHIALENHFPLRIVADAGHNAHVANPQGFAEQLLNFLKEC